MEPIDYGGALLRSWRLLVVLGVVGALVGFLLPVHHVKKVAPYWSTTAEVGAAPSAGPGQGGLLDSAVSTSQIVYFAKNANVAAAAGQQIGLNEPGNVLESAISVIGPTKKTGIDGVVELTGVMSSPALSAAFTNAFANELGTYMNDQVLARKNYRLAGLKLEAQSVQNRINALGGAAAPAAASLDVQEAALLQQEQTASQASASTGYEILQPAQADFAVKSGGGTSALGSSHLVRGLVGLAAGLIIGCVVVLLMELADRRLRSVSRAEATFGFPVVAEIPRFTKGGPQAELIGATVDLASPTAEAYRMLRMSLILEEFPVPEDEVAAFADADARTANGRSAVAEAPGNGQAGHLPAVHGAPAARQVGDRQVILVVSAGAEATRPVVVANLAATYADAGQRVIVMSTQDLHQRRPTTLVGPRAEEVRPSDVQAHLKASPLPLISLLSFSPFVSSTGQLAEQAPKVLGAARLVADVVIVEAPPLLAVHDGEALSPAADVVLVVGECLATRFDQARKVGALLRRIGAPVLGVVLTNMHVGSKDIRRTMMSAQGRPDGDRPPDGQKAPPTDQGSSAVSIR